MIILLAVLALVVVKALAASPWGTFTVFATIPIAILMGLYVRFIRPGRIGEMSAIGVVLLMLAIVFGQTVSESPALAPLFTYSGQALALTIIGYGFVASVLPVWLLLAPRDFDRVRADLRAKRAEDGREFNEINPKGYVPALMLDGQLLTDNVAILCWVAERAPGARAGH
jgi:hypothetical protein